ncbi:hypothetical protein, partial [Escherichia coli]|uniref:hypothetical protein n=1 Tax=Escherichia coli TaxID=562 RepID=UPI0019D4A17B
TDGDGSHGSTSKTPSYTKSVSWHHYQKGLSHSEQRSSAGGIILQHLKDVLLKAYKLDVLYFLLVVDLR